MQYAIKREFVRIILSPPYILQADTISNEIKDRINISVYLFTN